MKMKHSINKNYEKDGGMAQVAERLPKKCESLS